MASAAVLRKELLHIVMQYLREEKYFNALHMLQQESHECFDVQYLEQLILKGQLTEADQYLQGFTKMDENAHSIKIFFEIRKQKFLEQLDQRNLQGAVEVLQTDLKVFETTNPEIYREMTQLLVLKDIRHHAKLRHYQDASTARYMMVNEVKKLLEANPIFKDKLHPPHIPTARLRTMINQSLNWQHSRCSDPESVPAISSLYTDHTCAASSSSSNGNSIRSENINSNNNNNTNISNNNNNKNNNSSNSSNNGDVDEKASDSALSLSGSKRGEPETRNAEEIKRRQISDV